MQRRIVSADIDPDWLSSYGFRKFTDWPKRPNSLQWKQDNAILPHPAVHLSRGAPVRMTDHTHEALLAQIDALTARCTALESELAAVQQEYDLLHTADRQKDDILNSLVEHVILQAPNMTIRWVNKAASESLGLSQTELIGRYCHEVWGQQDEPCDGCPVKLAMETGEPQEAVQTTPDDRMWFIRGYPVWDADGNLTGGVELTLEITGEQQALHALQESELRFRGLAENVHDGIAIIDNGKTVYVNDQLCEIVGLDRAELMAIRGGFDIAAPEELPRLKAIYEQSQREGGTPPAELEYTILRPDGQRRRIQNRYSSMDASKWDMHFIVTTDVTKQRALEEARARSEALYRGIFDGVRDAILVEALDGRILDVNEAACEMYGASREALLARHVRDIVPDDALALVPAEYGMLQDLPSEPLETVNLRLNGERFPVEITAHIREIESEPVLLVVVRDISARKQAEAQRQINDKRLALVIDSSNDGFWDWDLTTNAVYYSPRWQTMLGYTPGELEPLLSTWERLVHPEDKLRVLGKINAHIEGGTETFFAEMRMKCKDGCWRWVMARGKVVARNADGEPVRICGVHTDMTDRKMMEEALRASEEQFRSVMEKIPMGLAIFELTDEGGFMLLDGNPAAENLFNTQVNSNRYRRVLDIIPALAETKLIRVWKEVLATGQAAAGVYDVISSAPVQGTFEWMAFQIGPGKLAVVFSDISERIERERALRESEDKFAKAFMTSPDSININRLSDGLYLEVNEGFTALTGYTAEDVAGRTSAAINVWADMTDRARLVDALKRDGYVRGLEVPFRIKNGDIRTGLMSARVIELNGEMCIISITRDIHDRKLAEEEIRQLNEDLEARVKLRTAELEATNDYLLRLTKVKDEFVSNVSHELRTPITNLKLHHYLLKAQRDRFEEHLDVVRRETQRLDQIVEMLLHLSRLDQGADDVVVGPVNLNAMIENYTHDRVELAELEGVAIQAVLHPGPLVVQGDEGLLGQCLSILLTNACNYTPSGGQITLRTLAREQDGRQWAGFSVADTGPGILPEERDRLFERFFRGSAGQQSGKPGTGLGLALVKELVKRHEGIIEVDSVPGEGATFTIWLPV
jgi:two-component system cell cycle sensor histidine kinase/response regulator CckA